ncbi:MAG: hypothetical protein QGG67_07300 [Gammaproteobacteria bacterium]|jgi:hypothetical protein|nr:hypothetical protein [Gammaproteobacteria bacterium]MDP6095775.1 hypothetical protein [Gammaproteobacteria bacterium]MDP7456202.1 hypothetical protein [Gammaproteobacteria bacterium]|tara:strand:+ start:3186 stop:3650 length:465 start_codon:yes stop_codon:yes gene_type:complete
MKKSVLVWLPVFLLVWLFSTLHAAEDDVVIEDLSPAELRDEIGKIQTEFYRVFNLLNSDDKLDIVCHKYVPTDSIIKQEACEPQFLIDKRADNFSDYQYQRDELLSLSDLQAVLAAEFRALTEEMNAVAQANDYFRDLTSILGVLRERLEEITN